MKRIDKSVDLQKATFQDKRRILADSLENAFVFEGEEWNYSPYLLDFDEAFVYFESYDGTAYISWKTTYTFDGTSATFGDTIERVVSLTEWTVIGDEEPTQIEKTITKLLNKFFGDVEGNALPVIKQFNEEEMIAIEPLYICAGDIDGHGDTISLEETHSMVKSFNEANESGSLQTSLFHAHKTESFEVVKAWVNEVDCTIGETVVKEGQPIAKIHFLNEDAWELRKTGELMGLSIGARAKSVEVLV